MNVDFIVAQQPQQGQNAGQGNQQTQARRASNVANLQFDPHRRTLLLESSDGEAISLPNVVGINCEATPQTQGPLTLTPVQMQQPRRFEQRETAGQQGQGQGQGAGQQQGAGAR